MLFLMHGEFMADFGVSTSVLDGRPACIINFQIHSMGHLRFNGYVETRLPIDENFPV